MATIEQEHLMVTKKGTLPRVPFLAIKEKVLGKKYVLSISFVSPEKALALNMQHRKKTYTPNTLSFTLSPYSGEIVMCLPAIKKEYARFSMKYREYLIFLLIHSMLHLKGYVHGSTMEDKEQQYATFFK